jgi:hypothetical protein
MLRMQFSRARTLAENKAIDVGEKLRNVRSVSFMRRFLRTTVALGEAQQEANMAQLSRIVDDDYVKAVRAERPQHPLRQPHCDRRRMRPSDTVVDI